MREHLNDGGVILVEPWFTPEQFHDDKPHAVFVDEPDLKIARMNVSRVESKISFLDFHYTVATSRGVEYFTEVHELGLFTVDEHLQAFRECGLEVIHDPEGIFGRGLYIGIK